MSFSRRQIVRVLIAGLLDFALLGSASALMMSVLDATGSKLLSGLAGWALAVPFVVWLAPKVSYRRRDAFLGPYVVPVLAWRLAHLPFRDWPPRADEVARRR